MAKDKNKKLGKKGKNKKGDKHTFLRKEWHKLFSPSDLKNTQMVGWTCVNKTSGTKVSTDYLKGRVGEITAMDLTVKGDNESGSGSNNLSRKIKMFVEEVKDGSCYTSFYGYDMTRESICSVVRKRSSLIDIYTDVRTNDGYVFRVFITSISIRGREQVRVNSFCKSSTIRLLRLKTVQFLQDTIKAMKAEEFANQLVDQSLQSNVRKHMKSVYPNILTFVRKVKLIRKGEVDRKKFLKKSLQSSTATEATIQENPEAKNGLTE